MSTSFLFEWSGYGYNVNFNSQVFSLTWINVEIRNTDVSNFCAILQCAKGFGPIPLSSEKFKKVPGQDFDIRKSGSFWKKFYKIIFEFLFF